MSKRTFLVCDACGTEIKVGTGALSRTNFADPKKGSKVADLCDGCADASPGTKVARRGRKAASP